MSCGIELQLIDDERWWHRSREASAWGKWSKEGGFLPLRTMDYIGDDEDGPAWAQGRSIQPTGGELDGRGWSVAPGGTRS
jgi:hypothetical protein